MEFARTNFRSRLLNSAQLRGESTAPSPWRPGRTRKMVCFTPASDEARDFVRPCVPENPPAASPGGERTARQFHTAVAGGSQTAQLSSYCFFFFVEPLLLLLLLLLLPLAPPSSFRFPCFDCCFGSYFSSENSID